MRSGHKAARRTLVVHARRPVRVEDAVDGADAAATIPGPARVGFVVSRAVGSAVARNRVRRRLRALVASRLSTLGDGWFVVVRALPPAAAATSAALAADLESALQAVVRPARSGAAR